MIDSTIVDALLAVRNHAYAPYSDHPVGALAESDSGARYAGANVESTHYKSLCAEAVAIAAMVSDGHRLLENLYIIGPGSALCTPCGDCRQRIREFATSSTRIHILDAHGRILQRYSVDELLPDAFGPELA